jgi:putative ABC transport system permease protein
MAAPRWNKVARDLLAHKTRTVLVVLSIAVGVFAVAVVMGGRQVLLREFSTDFSASVKPSIEFDTTGFDEALVRAVAEREDVRAAEARRRVTARYSTRADEDGTTAGWETIRLWALPSFERSGVSKIVRDSGSAWPPGKGEVVLEKSALQLAQFSVGETLTVESAAGTRVDLRIVGFAHDINAIPAQFMGAVTGYISLDTLASLTEPSELNHLSVVLDPSLSRATASRIAADIRDTDLSAAGVTVLRSSVPEPGSHFLADIFKALSLLLLALGLMALALSGFLVVTTVSAIMAQQVRQIGIMKAIGGRRAQIGGMYFALVLGYGILGVAVGVPAGLAAGERFTRFAAEILNFRVTDYTPPTWVIALEIGVGLLVPVLAAAFPVRQGATLPVARALSASGIAPDFGHGLVDRALGLVRGLPRPVALSIRNTFLRKGRLALTLTTLVLASAVVMAVFSARASMLTTVEDIGAWWNYDAQVFFSRPQPAEEVEREAAQVEGVTAVETWVESQASLRREDGSENEEIIALGVPGTTRFIVPRIVAGRWLEPGDDDGIVVNTDVLKEEKNLSVGDPLTLSMRGEERTFEIVGVATGQLMGPVVFIERERLDGILGTNGVVTRLLVQTTEHTADSQARVARELERRLDKSGVPLSSSMTQDAQKETIASQLGILVTFLVIMAALLAAVGVIGLTGTMSINVIESTREIGVMRSIGASHVSIFSIFTTEAIVVAVMAWGMGAVISWPLSVWLVSSLGTAMSLPLSYSFSWLGVGGWLALVIVIGALASALPAWRASRVSIRDAISYE